MVSGVINHHVSRLIVMTVTSSLKMTLSFTIKNAFSMAHFLLLNLVATIHFMIKSVT